MNQQLSSIIDQSPGFMGWKNRDLTYAGCNANLATMLGLQCPDNIVGLTDRDLRDFTEESYQFHHHNDLLALSGKTVHCLHQSTTFNGEGLFTIIKKPLIDNEKKIIGIIYHCTPMQTTASLSMMQQDKRNLVAMPAANINKLSAREMECLFYVLRGKTLKEIAIMLQLSRRTIETYFENIKNKFGCTNKTELLVQAISKGYMNIIPDNLIESQ